MGYNLFIKGVYWGYNPSTNLLLTSWDILVVGEKYEPKWIISPFCEKYIVLETTTWKHHCNHHQDILGTNHPSGKKHHLASHMLTETVLLHISIFSPDPPTSHTYNYYRPSNINMSLEKGPCVKEK